MILIISFVQYVMASRENFLHPRGVRATHFNLRIFESISGTNDFENIPTQALIRAVNFLFRYFVNDV